MSRVTMVRGFGKLFQISLHRYDSVYIYRAGGVFSSLEIGIKTVRLFSRNRYTTEVKRQPAVFTNTFANHSIDVSKKPQVKDY